MKMLYSLIAICMCFTLCLGQPSNQFTSPEFKIPFGPELVIIDGKPTAYYELYITNRATDSLLLQKLAILDASGASEFISWNEKELRSRYSIAKQTHQPKRSILAPGSSAIVYIELEFKQTPAMQIVHHLDYQLIKKAGAEAGSAHSTITKVASAPPLVLGAPLASGTWAAIYEPSWERGHRRVIYTVGGKDYIPGRFAIDFIRLDATGQYAKGDSDSIRNWYGYNNDVIAVADGVVASSLDTFQESPTVSAHPKFPADKATGNYISLDISNNHLVFYEHLKPGSIKVKAGQKVTKGEIIASLGFTGQTTGPHLHFHVANQNAPLGAEGLPYAFENFILLGRYTDIGKLGSEPWIPLPNTDQANKKRERPAPNTVIVFKP
jgi:hypothetical protein